MKYKIFLILTVYSLLFNCCHQQTQDAGAIGNKLTLLDGDKPEDRVIVYCTSYDVDECTAGMYVVPSYKDHFDKQGKYREYVDQVKWDKKWIIAKTVFVKEKGENYWIINKGLDIDNLDCDKINCDSIIQTFVTGPLKYEEFVAKSRSLGLHLEFKQ